MNATTPRQGVAQTSATDNICAECRYTTAGMIAGVLTGMRQATACSLVCTVPNQTNLPGPGILAKTPREPLFSSPMNCRRVSPLVGTKEGSY